MEAALAVAPAQKSRADEQHRDAAQLRIGVQPLKSLIAGAAGHVYAVAHDQAAALAFRDREGLGDVKGGQRRRS